MPIEIDGLSTRQQKIADLMWSMDTQEEVYSFIESLNDDLQRDAILVLKMILFATLDTVMETDLAKAELERFML
jgi:hypothetical protein